MTQSRLHKYLGPMRRFLRLDKLPPLARKLVVFTAGGFLLLAGLIMLVTPGPGLILIPLGLLILGFESARAEAAAQKILGFLQRTRRRTSRKTVPRRSPG
jgi:hypothetical protein